MVNQHVDNSRGASWMISLGCSFFVVSAAGIIFYFISCKTRKTEAAEGDPQHDMSSYKRDATKSSRFPWEDDGQKRERIEDSQPNSSPKKSPPRQTTQPDEDFLASMTFAQTGLRTPSCPCCQ
mmetsp:Transcript_20550/g.38980  ORF Transcript_20550/g.38980 Transcript_20550/m.38980 type:complete len:123 (-) Transcript_20550:610-978(-)